MTNEKKAKEIVENKPFTTSISPIYKYYMYDGVMEMAQWKDRQIEIEKQAQYNKGYYEAIENAMHWFYQNGSKFNIDTETISRFRGFMEQAMKGGGE